MRNVRTRVDEKTFARLEKQIAPGSTMAALVRDILVQHVALGPRVQPLTIPATGCFCHEADHVVCWSVSPNEDCLCCMDTVALIKTSRRAAATTHNQSQKGKKP